ncbi:capsule biosynthesis protein [Qipengyuania sp. GH25]|uniref:Capsule biosynthesis protein n=1 Tax=Qipengyuania pacifica TaxID=2860199 RepID=A0ABS7JCS1_9SPHN|nr:Wzz/FepE/Etk N-terminal domain-containing protein [Qipengyuania aerophila]MBX7487831.1 capsule biosynthesis protein [Qipengyuania aerophila]
MNAEQSFPIETKKIAVRSAISVWLRKRRWFVLIVVVPTLFVAVYYGLFASDIYVSEARFVIKSPDEKRPQISSLANLVQTTGLSSGQEQAKEILEFVRSRDALRDLQKEAGIREKYAEKGDFLSRFPGPFNNKSFEDLYKYYSKMVDAHLDTENGTAVLTVKAFTPEDAFVINRTLLDLSEALVNKLNERAQNKVVSEAERQVLLAVERARRARVALATYRNTQELIDPEQQAVGVLEISNSMVARRATLQAQLDEMQRVAPANPSISALRNQIAAMSVQIAAQDTRVVGSQGGIASKMGGYEDLFVEQEFATENLTAANAALAQARNEAQRQQFYLVRIVEANKPDTPLLPRRLLNIIVCAAVLTCLYFIGWMLVVGILEHAPED